MGRVGYQDPKVSRVFHGMEWILPCSSLFGLNSEWLKVYMNKAGEVLLRYWWNKFLGVSILISFEGLAREVTSTADLFGNEPGELVHPKCQHIWRLKTQFCCEFWWAFDAHMTPICWVLGVLTHQGLLRIVDLGG
jgi:hypothetical protein